MIVLDSYNKENPTHSRQDYRDATVYGTTCLKLCEEAYKAWQKEDTVATRNALAAARVRLRIASQLEPVENGP